MLPGSNQSQALSQNHFLGHVLALPGEVTPLKNQFTNRNRQDDCRYIHDEALYIPS